MAKVIIGIHGLQNKPCKEVLQDWWIKSMEEGLAGIGIKSPLPPVDLIYWADTIYEKPLSADITDEDDPCYLDDLYIPAPKDFVAKTSNAKHKVFGFLNTQLRKFFLGSNFNLKHQGIAESVVERYFHDLDIYYEEPGSEEYASHSLIRKKIVERVVSTLMKYNGYEIFLIGHSMGSILSYDALQFEVPDIPVHTFVTIGSPLGLPLVLCKIAARQGKVLDGAPVLRTPASVLRNWYNFSDPDDIIALNPNLGAEFFENFHGVKPLDISVSNNYIINNRRNAHKEYGYLRTKEFAKVLASFMEEKQGFFRRIQRALSSMFNKLKSKFG
jgi:hypothetical protein